MPRVALPDQRAAFEPGDALSLPVDAASKAAIVLAGGLRCVTDKVRPLAEMPRVADLDANYRLLWMEYPGGGIEFLQVTGMRRPGTGPASGYCAGLTL